MSEIVRLRTGRFNGQVCSLSIYKLRLNLF